MQISSEREQPLIDHLPAGEHAAAWRVTRSTDRRTRRTVWVLIFLVGLLQMVTTASLGLSFAGQIFIGELLLAPVAVWGVLRNLRNPSFWEPSFRLLLITLALSFIGYVASDLLNGTATTNIIRGWARMAFLILDIVSLHAICRKHPMRILPFVLGLSASYVFSLSGSIFNRYTYKELIAFPLLVTILAIAPFFPTRQRYFVTALLWISLGLLNFVLDFRTFGILSLIGGAIMLSKVLATVRLRALYGITLALAIILASGGVVYSLASTSSAYGGRRLNSNSERIASATAALYGIRKSPVFGNGSWASSAATDEIATATLVAETGRRLHSESGGLPGHSELLQVWYEAGLLGLAFFLHLFVMAFRTCRECIFRAPMSTLYPLTLLFGMISIDSFLVSPFGGSARFTIAISVTLFLIQRRTLREHRRELALQAWQAEMRAFTG